MTENKPQTSGQIHPQSDTEVLLRRVLRIAPEPCQTFGDSLVHRLLTESPRDYLDYLRSELAAIASGSSQIELPPKQVFTDPGPPADFRVMPCVVRRGTAARKIVKIVGTNISQQIVPDQITVGKAFALHPRENFVTHIFDACLLSSARTGACAALAVELLAGCRTRVNIVGAGRVGYYTAFYTGLLPGVGRICLSDAVAERAVQTAALLAQQLPQIAISARPFEQMEDCDVLALATTSSRPFCRPPGLGARLVVSLGADMDAQHELDPAWAAAAEIFVDGKDCLRFGDLHAWLQAGLVGPSAVTELMDLLRRPVPPQGSMPRVFVSTGSALFDNLTIGYLLNREQDGSKG